MPGCGISRIVFSGTCAVYGTPHILPVLETEAPQPINAYGRTKLAVEHFLSDMAAAGAVRAVLLRYFNAAGADGDGEIGEAHSPETHLVPLAIQAGLRSDSPLSIFGTDYLTADGTCERDYIHVEDLAEAHLRALPFLDPTRRQPRIQSGHRSAGIGAARRPGGRTRAGARVPVIEAPRRVGDPPRLFAAPGRAERDPKWMAAQSATRWHRSNVFLEAV